MPGTCQKHPDTPGIKPVTKPVTPFLQFPLVWPEQYPRSGATIHTKRFTDFPTSCRNLCRVLNLFAEDTGLAVTNVVISSNVDRQLAWPNPEDAGVALYFDWDGRTFTFACDKFDRPYSNVIGVYYIVQARRTEARLGTLVLTRASMSGLTYLPKSRTNQKWWEIFGVSRHSTIEEIESVFRQRAQQTHPDKGGSVADMQALIRAREEAILEKTKSNKFDQ